MTHQGTKEVKHENKPLSILWNGLDFLSQCSKVDSHLHVNIFFWTFGY